MQAMAQDPGRGRHRDQPREDRSPSCGCDVDRAARQRPGRAGAASSARRCARRWRARWRRSIEDAAGDSHDVRVRLRADQRRYADDLLRADRAHRQGRRQQGQDAGAAARGGDGRAGHRPVDHPPQGPACARCASRANPDGRVLGEITRRHRGRGAKLDLPPGYDIVARRRRRGAEGHVREHVPGALPGRRLHLPDPGLAVRLVHPAASRSCCRCRCRSWAWPWPCSLTARHAEHHEHDRPHHADGPRDQERDPARGLHEPGARARAWRGTRR